VVLRSVPTLWSLGAWTHAYLRGAPRSSYLAGNCAPRANSDTGTLRLLSIAVRWITILCEDYLVVMSQGRLVRGFVSDVKSYLNSHIKEPKDTAHALWA
jgi:hypothetical protein